MLMSFSYVLPFLLNNIKDYLQFYYIKNPSIKQH